MQHPRAAVASVTIRGVDPILKQRLRVRAAEHGHSMEAEARQILHAALQEPALTPDRNLYQRIRARVEPLGGIDLELPAPEPSRDPPRFD